MTSQELLQKIKNESARMKPRPRERPRTRLRSGLKLRLRRILRPIPQAGFTFLEEEIDRRLDALAGLLVAREALQAKLGEERDVIEVKPRELLGMRLFYDYLDQVNKRVWDARGRYREADEALLTEQRRLVGSFGVKPRRFAAEMGKAYERFEKSAHYWKYSLEYRPVLM